MKDSESLYGTVDFESGVCDFSGELFEKLLEVLKRYGYEESKAGWKGLSAEKPYYSFYCFNNNSNFRQRGKVPVGYLFDEGGYTEMQNNVLAINVNSPNKEGAWEFICFMLGDEVQLDFYTDETNAARGKGVSLGSFPVSRSAFEEL